MKTKTKKLALLAMCTALALILSYVESLFPPLVAIPGVKVGLANLVVMFTLYRVGAKEAFGIGLVRVVLVALLFGSMMSLWYSLAGMLLSFFGMLGMKQIKAFSYTSVSVVGGVLHNMGQILMACLVLETDVIRYYAPFLVLSGTLAGIAIGAVAAMLIKRVDIKI